MTRKRYSHRTIEGVRVAIDVDYRVMVVDDAGNMLLELGKVMPHPTHSRKWMAYPAQEITAPMVPSTGADFDTQAIGIAELLRGTAWYPGEGRKPARPAPRDPSTVACPCGAVAFVEDVDREGISFMDHKPGCAIAADLAEADEYMAPAPKLGSPKGLSADLSINGSLMPHIVYALDKAVYKAMGMVPEHTGLEFIHTSTHVLIKARDLSRSIRHEPVHVQVHRGTGTWVFLDPRRWDQREPHAYRAPKEAL